MPWIWRRQYRVVYKADCLKSLQSQGSAFGLKTQQQARAKVDKLYEWEFLRRTKAKYIAGVDEAGRGPMAGPVVSAAVILPVQPKIANLNDSKKLSPKMREQIFKSIIDISIAFGIGIRSSRFIDQFGIVVATFASMKTALRELVMKGHNPDLVVVDGYSIPELEMNQQALIRADSKVASVACASIIAKVVRDRMMVEFSSLYPGYGFENHKGYCTKDHMKCLNEKGPSPIHRRSFEPVRKMISGYR